MILRLLCLLLATSAMADDGCHDLWLARNATMDRAGYCFGSVLGQAVFDNTGCIGTSVALAPREQAIVAQIQSFESQYGCQVDTSRPVLDADLLNFRLALTQQPVRDELESACLGWLGSPVPLHAGPDPSMPILGQITPGAYVSYAHLPVGNWSYVTVSGPDWVKFSGGWLDRATFAEQCADIAG